MGPPICAAARLVTSLALCLRFITAILTFRLLRCVLELHAIAASGRGRFEVAMTEKERHRFLNEVRTSTQIYYNMLGRVDAECSDCSRAVDRESIHQAIRSTVGFAKLNRMVIEVLEGWMDKELRRQLKACEAFSDGYGDGHVHASEWQHTLGVVLHQQGRYDESIAFQESSLKHQQTVHGDDDLRTCKLQGVGWSPVAPSDAFTFR